MARRERIIRRMRWTLPLVALLALCVFSSAAYAMVDTGQGSVSSGPWIVSDQSDYAPGSTVHLVGGSWQVGEAVHILTNDSIGNTWSRTDDVVADASGDITDDVVLPNSFVANYSVTATGAQSGTATTTFTDSQPTAFNVGSPTSASTAQGNAATYGSVAVTMGGSAQQGPCSVTLSAGTVAGDTGLPAGATAQFGTSSFTGTTDFNSTLAISTTSSTVTGTYTFHVMANRGSGCQGNGATPSAQQMTLTIGPGCTAASVATQPTNQSITYGANATFTAAGAGNPAPTVQWQVSPDGTTYTNIAGATNTTLTLTKPGASASGNRYRAVFTNTCSGTQTAITSGATLTVAAKGLSISGAKANDKVYDGDAVAAVDWSSANLVGVVAGESVSIDHSGYSASFASKTVANNKPLTVTGVALGGADAGNYTVSQPGGLNASITAKPLSVSFQVENKVYDGNATATIKSSPAASLVGAVSGDAVTLDGSHASASFDTKAVGAGKTVTASGFALSGADAGNYSLASPQGTTTANIAAKNLTIDGAKANDKVYDGNSSATVDWSSASLTGPVSGDDVSLDHSGYTATFDSKNVGTSKPVTITGVALGGSDAGNYTVSQPSGLTANITQAPLDIYATSDSKTYDGGTSSSKTPTVGTGQLQGNDSVDGLSQAFDSKNVTGPGNSTFVVTSGYTVHDGNNGTNYDVHAHTASGTISARAITVTAAANAKTYDRQHRRRGHADGDDRVDRDRRYGELQRDLRQQECRSGQDADRLGFGG